VPESEIESMCQYVYGDSRAALIPDRLSLCFFVPKIICVISRNPFYRAMRRYLRQLYSLSLSHMPAPLEAFISCLVSRLEMQNDRTESSYDELIRLTYYIVM
jgi:hypothetical protein